jgi:hypothetical protein
MIFDDSEFTLKKNQTLTQNSTKKLFAIANVSRLRRKRKVSEKIRKRFGLDEGTNTYTFHYRLQ